MKFEKTSYSQIDRCPKCGSKKLVYVALYGLLVKKDLSGHIIPTDPITGKRVKSTLTYKAFEYTLATSKPPAMIQLHCERCGWDSENLYGDLEHQIIKEKS